MIRQRSKKMEAKYRVRRPMVKQYMEEHPVCERCLMARSTDPHEPLTRARGGSIVDPENLVALCRECHSWIHECGYGRGLGMDRRLLSRRQLPPDCEVRFVNGSRCFNSGVTHHVWGRLYGGGDAGQMTLTSRYICPECVDRFYVDRTDVILCLIEEMEFADARP